MPERTYHALEFEPGKSDPNRRWAVSIKEPMAALIAMGKTALVCKSARPPSDLMGKRIALHAGAGHVPYGQFTDHAAAWAFAAFGAELKALRHLLPHGGIIATVKLEAAFRVGRVIDGHVWANPKGHYSVSYMGTWHRHDGARIFEVGETTGRWVWALTEPKLCANLVPLRGYGGVFDLEGAQQLEARNAAGRGGQ